MAIHSLSIDVQDRIKDLFSVFDSLEIHAALIVVKKSVMLEVQNSGTSVGKKFLQLNPDVGTNFLHFCASYAKIKDPETYDSTSAVEDYSNDALCSAFELNGFEQPVQESEAVRDKVECTDTTSVLESAFNTDEKVSGENGFLLPPRVKMEQESGNCQVQTLFKTEDNSESEVSKSETEQGTKPAFPCPVKDCMKIFTKKFSVTRHVLRKHRESPCETCRQTFPSQDSLEEHVEACHAPASHRKTKLYYCEVCHQKCHGKFSLVRHRLRKHSSKHLTCTLCGKGFASASLLREHKKLSHFDEWKKCSQCEEKFTSKGVFANHMKKHNTDRVKKVFKCKHCTEVFDSKPGLRKHRRKMHSEAKHQCQICGKCYVEKRDLTRHEQTHSGYKCQYCTKVLRSERVLHDHENGHTRKNKFVCDICGTEFYSSASLGHHRKRHIFGSAAFKRSKSRCVFCPMLFDQTSQLSRHLIAKHLQEALASESPYVKQCRQCSKVFPAEKFQRHMNMHTDTKEHKCLVCGKAFVEKGNAYQHMVRVHKMEKFPCQVCRRVFWNNVDLDNHGQVEHI